MKIIKNIFKIYAKPERERERESKHLFFKLINIRHFNWLFKHVVAVISCVLIVFFGIVALTRATTIGTDISTGGTLSVTGISAFSANVGIGTTSPYAKLSVVGETVSLYFTATSTAATSTFPYLTSAQIAITGLSAGSIPFIGAGGVLSQNNANLFWDNTNYRLGIGTTTPSAKLEVAGDLTVTGDIERVPTSSFLPTRIAGLTLNSGENSGMAVAVSGRYAYVITNTVPGKLVVIDISVPTAPARMGAVTLPSGENSLRGLSLSGKYAYISTGDSPAKIVVIDISNPISPVRISALTLNSGENDARGIEVVGKYAYLATWTSPTRVVVVDISEPTLPVRVGAVTLNSGENSGTAIAVSGNYAFVCTDTGNQAKIVSVNISVPTAPVRLDDIALTWDSERNARQIVIQGRYAYVPSDQYPSKITVIDISNSSALVRTGGIILESDENANSALAIAGRYVYTLGGGTGETSKIQVIDVTNPAAPVNMGRTILNSGENTGRSMALSGRYIYVATYDNPFKFVVLDVGGAEVSTMMAHSLEASEIYVRKNLNVYDHIRVGGGLNIGGAAYLPVLASGKVHINTKLSVPQATSTPVVSSCGTSPAIIGNDFAGAITVGTGTVNACTIAFANAFITNAPSCVVSGTSTSVLYISSQSTTAITIGCTTCGGTTINYHCVGIE